MSNFSLLLLQQTEDYNLFLVSVKAASASSWTVISNQGSGVVQEGATQP